MTVNMGESQAGDFRIDNAAQNIYRQGADADLVINRLLLQVQEMLAERNADRANRELRQNYLDRRLDSMDRILSINGAILVLLLVAETVDVVERIAHRRGVL